MSVTSMKSMESEIKIPGIQQLVRNGTTKWQVYHNKVYLGYFSTFDEAVQAKADAMEIQPKMLRSMSDQSNKVVEEPSKYKGITKISRNGIVYWQAYSGRKYLGCSKSLSSAVTMVGAYEGEKPEERPRRDWYGLERQVEHFRVNVGIYTDSNGKPILPSDLQSSVDVRQLYPRLALEAPALQYIMFMGKHGPFKVSTATRWSQAFTESATESSTTLPTSLKSLKSMTSTATSLKSLKSMTSTMSLRSLRGVAAEDLHSSDLDCLIHLLQASALDIKDNDFKYWNLNVGHRNCFYSGPMIFLSRFLGVITKHGSSFSLCKRSSLPDCRDKLRLCHSAGMVLNGLPVRANLTLVDYNQFVTSAMKDLQATHPPGLNPDGKYSIPWILRTKLIAETYGEQKSMKSMKSVKVLQYKRTDPIQLISDAFPDSKEWLQKFGAGMSSVGELMDILDYGHGVEVLTMFFCLFGDADVLAYNVESLKQHEKVLNADVIKYLRQHGVVPHPVNLLKRLRALVQKRPASQMS